MISETVGNQTVDIGGNQTVDIGGNKTDTVAGDKIDNVTGTKDENIDGAKTETLGAGKTNTITGAYITTATTITFTATGAAKLSGSSVLLGSGGAGKSLMTSDIITIFNAHTHNYSDTGGGTGTQPTTPPLAPNTYSSADATTKTTAD